MHINLPLDCGNAPRIAIVGDFVINWAKGEADAVSAWLDENSVWTLVGQETYCGTDAAAQLRPRILPERLELISIITHGRLASCDGFLEAGSSRIDFSHAFRFASTSKSAKIKHARSYCIKTRTS